MLSREELIRLAARNVFGGKVLNNAHRGDIVEAMVLAALGDDWRLVGLGWHSWDLQKGSGHSRVRIQVKQCAALQLWGETKKPSLSFGWKKKAPSYFEQDNPGENIESHTPAKLVALAVDAFPVALGVSTLPSGAERVRSSACLRDVSRSLLTRAVT